MEQDVDTGYRTMCSTCLSTDRNLFHLNNLPQVNQIFKLLMYDFAGDRVSNITCFFYEGEILKLKLRKEGKRLG